MGDLSRGTWTQQLDFILSCVGYSVGLGNLWRFPYLCMRNGGGAFLIPYYLFLFTCGMPLFFMELILGQYSNKGPLTVWELSPLFKGLGWGMIIVSGILTVYYNIIIAWTLYYLGRSFTSELPWATCNNTWNTERCSKRGTNMFAVIGGNLTNHSSSSNDLPVFSLANASSQYYNSTIDFASFNLSDVSVLSNITKLKTRTPTEEFWQFETLDLSSGLDQLGSIKWPMLLCLAVAWVVVFLCLCRGIRSIGKVVYFTATAPYIFFTILLIRGLTLPGAIEGIKFYLVPDFSKLANFNVWAEACLQMFYVLGPAWGGLITMSSYNRFNNNCQRDSIILCLICTGSSFYAGFVIFSVIGFMAHEAGLPVNETVTSGPGLAFIVYPEALARLPLSPMWSILFFLMLFTLGLDSQFTTVETLVSGLVDQFPKYLRHRKFAFTAFVCLVEFTLGLPLVTQGGMYVFQILDWYSAAFSVMVIAFLECIVVSWVYGWRRLSDDVYQMLGSRPSGFWLVCWSVVTPGIVLMMIIFSAVQMDSPSYGDYVYPPWARGVGWCVAMVSIVPIPLVALVKVMNTPAPTIWQRIKLCAKPTANWKPSIGHMTTPNGKDSKCHPLPLDMAADVELLATRDVSSNGNNTTAASITTTAAAATATNGGETSVALLGNGCHGDGTSVSRA